MSPSNTPLPGISRLRSTVVRFARREDGGATIWNVTWLLVFAGMAGLAIDSSNGYRNIAISQSTSDAASLAGVMELPNPLDEVPFDPTEGAYDDTVKAKALEYAGKNMPWNPYGQVLMPDEIFVGNWSNKNGERRFTAGQQFDDLVEEGLYDSVDDVPVNAVRVYLFQDEEDRGNGVATSLMHMAGVPYWNVVTTATAMSGFPLCAANAFMAHRKYCQTSNSTYGEDLCLWADEGFFLKNGNEWQGNVVQTPPGANNDGIADGNFDDDGFWLNEDAAPLDVQFVEDIATFNDGDPGIAYDIMRGDSHYAQKVTTTTVDAEGNFIREAPSGDVIRLETNTIGTTETINGWLDSEPSVQVASLDGFASIAGLLGVSTHPTTGNIPPGCPQSRSNGSRVEPIGDYDRDIFGIEAGETEGDEGDIPNVQFAVDGDGNDVIHTSRDLPTREIYYHDDPKGLTIEGSLEGVVIVTRGAITIKGGSVLTDVTLVSLEDRSGGTDGISMSGSVTFGTADGNCNEEGGVKMYTMGSVTGSSGAQFNGAFIAAGGSVGFAANADSEQGVSVYSAGNIFHTSNNTITSCGVPITFDPDNLRHSLVD